MKYKCDLCGYIVGVEELNDSSFRCPKCGINKESFKLVEEEIDKRVHISIDNPGVRRTLEKCINCGVCKKVCNTKEGLNIDKNFCVHCGVCLMNCPTGALHPKYDYKEVLNIIKDGKKEVVAFTAPAVRVGLGEAFNYPFGENTEGKMITALRRLGFNYVFDTTFGADVTIMEEAKELLDRKKNNGVLPMFTSCCPSWVKYVNYLRKDLIPNLSTTKSPNGMMGSLVKSYFCEVNNINKSEVVTVGIVPCTAKKYECKLDTDVDYMLTTTELALMIQENNIDFNNLEDGKFDDLIGTGSSAGLIFGSSGGVMESSLRTLNYLITGKNDTINNIENIRGSEYFRESEINIDNVKLKVAVIYGLMNVQKFLESNYKDYDFIEVMNCENGCVGGAGNTLQLINKLPEIRNARLNKLFLIDKNSKVRYCHENELVKKLYKEYLTEDKIEYLLHRSYNG